MDHLLVELQPWSYSVRPAFEYINGYSSFSSSCYPLQGADPLELHSPPLVLGLEQEVHIMKIKQWYGTCCAWNEYLIRVSLLPYMVCVVPKGFTNALPKAIIVHPPLGGGPY